ncbi:rab-GTPase-TBC domain-containing protein [Halteromyces radiatus]|uniref:rab-GTPase-TBC domain-containing protein n=1 Tax=Halteromyces radiatus TaxID=101107 RepID=UPI00221E4859|nr:rab-GTPase-TBC domain-containing protein [Halteromyces radiatus]KAI8098480.1 rab-GTPase-TBC domain-containing protein [Halteromyces radiatus]
MDNKPTPSQSTEHSQDSEKEHDNHEFDLHEYDLDVVDSVLNNPHQNEYYDHFGFKIEVKTDDEDSEDTSDDEDTNDDDNENSKNTQQQQQQRRYSNPTSLNPKSTSSTSSSSSVAASDEDEYSIDTALTTPTTHKPQRISTSSMESHSKLNNGFNQGSSFTTTHIDTDKWDSKYCQDTTDHSSIPRTSQNSNFSQSSMGQFTQHYPNTTTTSRTKHTAPSIISTTPVQRPSQAFRERQSKRMSELNYTMSPIRSIPNVSSPPRTSTTSKRLSSASTVTESDDNERETPNQIKLLQDTLKLLEQERKAQPGEYDWDFWKEMVLDVDKVITTQGLALRHHLSMGIPDRLRGSLWQLLAKSRNQPGDMEAVFGELLKRTSPHEKLIHHDLDTSFPMAKFFPFPTEMVDTSNEHSQQYQSLFNVLKAYSLFDQDIGYSQSLSFIVAVLLKQIPNELSVFCLLIQLMGPFGIRGYLTESMDTLQLHLYQFDHLLQLVLPELYRHIDALGIRPEMYASRWFATCFAYDCSPSLVVRVLDIILVEGAYVMQRFILALLKKNQSVIMDLGFEALMKFFQVDIFEVYKGRRNEFVVDMYQIEISPKLYTRLAKQYNNEIARKIKRRTEDDEIRLANEQLTAHIHALQEKYRVLEMEHQEMTRQAVETKMAMAKMDADNEQLTHQLKQLKAQFEHSERQKEMEHQARLEDIYKSNAQLIKHNASLQDQIADMESVLIGLKMNFAERESEYEVIRRQLLDAQKS